MYFRGLRDGNRQDETMDEAKAAINASLAEVWGTDDDSGEPSENWPFMLEYWGTVDGWRLYRFSDGKIARYAGYDPEIGVISSAIADMTLEDLADEFRGGDWISGRDPVDVNQEPEVDESGDETAIPSRDDRLAEVGALSLAALGPDTEFTILSGYYLAATREYVALIGSRHLRGEAVVVATGMAPVNIGFPKASPERRICVVLGRNMPEQ